MRHTVLYIGMALAIPPYGFFTKPLGTTAQLIGVAVQAIGLVMIIASFFIQGD